MEVQTLKAEMLLTNKSLFDLGTQLEEKNAEVSIFNHIDLLLSIRIIESFFTHP